MNSNYNLIKESMDFYGGDRISLYDLLVLLIGPKANQKTVGQLASLGLEKINSMSIQELKEIEGVGDIIATRIKTAFHLSEYINLFKKSEKMVVRSPEDAAEIFHYLRSFKQEHFDVAFLNTKNEVIARKNIFKGSLNASIVHPREIVRP